MRPMRLKCSSNSAIISTSTLCLFGRFSFLFYFAGNFCFVIYFTFNTGANGGKVGGRREEK